ncbi:MAG TPA: hypothetical protein VF676_13470 [Flavobacterium sp.]
MMKLLLLLLLCNQAVSQDFIQKNDGTKRTIAKGSLHVSPANRAVFYQVPTSIEPISISYKDLDFARDGDRMFKVAMAGKKRRGFYILADRDGNQLGALFTRRHAIKGGFESPYIHYELAVIDSNGKVTKSMTFTDVNNEKNKNLRKEAISFMTANFPDCPNLRERLKLFSDLNDPDLNEALKAFFMDPYMTMCQ